MDTNEITITEDVIEATEEIATAGSGKGFKMAVGFGLTVLVGVIAYKYVVKPIAAKIKSKKNKSKNDKDAENSNDEVVVDESNEDE